MRDISLKEGSGDHLNPIFAELNKMELGCSSPLCSSVVFSFRALAQRSKHPSILAIFLIFGIVEVLSRVQIVPCFLDRVSNLPVGQDLYIS